MALSDPTTPVAGNPISSSTFGIPVANSIKELIKYTGAGQILYSTDSTHLAVLDGGIANALKIIRLNAAGDALEYTDAVSVISGRIGGSATVWQTPGTTSYAPTPGDYHIETGVVQIAVAGGSYSAPKVTYKTAFTEIPQVIVGSGFKLVSGSYSGVAVPGKSTEAADSFYATINFSTGTPTVTVDVTWMAIGH
jgi:hypothetical protein